MSGALTGSAFRSLLPPPEPGLFTPIDLADFLGDLPTGTRRIAAWVPGTDGHRLGPRIEAMLGENRRFDWRFPERLDPACREARRLLLGRHLGMAQQGGLTIRVHPDLLIRPGSVAVHDWLDDPWLNRIPALLWIFGPAIDHRLRISKVGAHEVIQLTLQHARPSRQSWLQIVISAGCTYGGHPDGIDALELSGSDGFLHVHGILGRRHGAPRLEMRRGPATHSQRAFAPKHTAPPRASADALRGHIAEYVSLCSRLQGAAEGSR